MDDLATNLDALQLAERLRGARAGEYWLHLEAEGPFEKYPGKLPFMMRDRARS
jgi:hypothetical protein